MNLFNLPYEQVIHFMMVFVRVASILAVAPFFGSRNIPAQTKAGLSILLAMVIYPLVVFEGVPLPRDLMSLAFLMSGEVFIGIVLGYAARLFFSAVQVAGQFIGFQLGFGIVNVLDPQTNAQVSVIAQFQNIIAMLFFLSTYSHFIFLRAMADSFTIVPPLGFGFSTGIVEIILITFSGVFVTALKISAPVLAALLFTTVSLGLIARTVPQINVFIVGIPMQICVGLFLLGMTMTFFGMLMKNVFGQMEYTLYSLLKAM